MRCWGELLKELKVWVRSVRTSHACNFRDIVEIKVSQAYNLSKSWLRPWLSKKLNNKKALHNKHKVQTNYRFIQTPSSRAKVLEKIAERIIGPTFSRGNCVRASSSIDYKSREGGNRRHLEGKQDGLQKCTLHFLPSLITNCQGRRMAKSA